MISRLRPKSIRYRIDIRVILVLFGTYIGLIWGLDSAYSSTLQVPSFVLKVPAQHYAGISDPAESVAKARRIATMDVVRQILGSIGVTYDYSANHQVKGNARHPQRRFDDHLSGTAKGLVLGVSKRIVKSSVSQDKSGRYICFILVHYPDTLIAEMRRLSLGANLSASFVRYDSDTAVIKVFESNGVRVTITSADVHIEKRNRFAKKISYFIMHVPDGSTERYSATVGPVTVCDGSKDVRLNLSRDSGISDFLLGADIKRTVVLSGLDEVGRQVSAKVVF